MGHPPQLLSQILDGLQAIQSKALLLALYYFAGLDAASADANALVAARDFSLDGT
jgi:hypothetical protein